MASLSIRKVRKVYPNGAEVLKGIDLEIADGEFLILVGGSGCGKSTLLNMIAGLEPVTDGEILIGGKVVNDVPPKARDIAMVFQSYALYPTMMVRENISFGLGIRKVPKDEQQQIVERVAETLQMTHLLDRKPAMLSGGQRQRVAMGRAIARDPALFLFDEPLSNLDAKLRVEMRAEIKLLHQRTRTTTVYVTHDQVEAMTLGDRIAVMKEGVVLQFGSPDDIYARPATRFVAEFIGSPAMNMIPAVRSASGAAANGIELELTPAQRTALQSSSTGTLTYGLRPEAVRFAPDGVPGTLRFTEPTGPETYATVETAVGLLTLRVPGYMAAKVGDAVHVQWTAESAHLFDATTDKRIG